MTESPFGKFVASTGSRLVGLGDLRWLDFSIQWTDKKIQIHTAALFLVVSTGQMALWATKKHKAYKREFGDKYPRGRKAMIPFIF